MDIGLMCYRRLGSVSSSFLPYLIGGISETKNDEREYTARAGADLRYEITPQLRLMGAANPDFENIEQAVESIDFSYGERYVPDRRPFFSEGGNAYWLDNFFHSRRIIDMDGGIKLFGKLHKNTSIGTLGTYHQNNQNFVFRGIQSLSATSLHHCSFPVSSPTRCWIEQCWPSVRLCSTRQVFSTV